MMYIGVIVLVTRFSSQSCRIQVVVFTGLFEVTPNEDALASVLGHEVGHVVANHGGEKLSKVRRD